MHVIPLGGCDTFGRSCTAYSAGGATLLVDCGAQFPDERAPGVTRYLPSFTGLLARYPPPQALFLTHGHEDHIAAVPYLLKEMQESGQALPAANLAVYAAPFTLRLLQGALDQHRVPRALRDLRPLLPGAAPLSVGALTVRAIGVPHSIPASLSLQVSGPGADGALRSALHTGDFKLDEHDQALRGWPREAVDLLVGDSTNATRPGRAGEESTVTTALQAVLAQAPGRVAVALFSSHVERVANFASACLHAGRKLLLLGAKLREVCAAAEACGLLPLPAALLVDEASAARLPPRALAILCTGSQGEPEAALARLRLAKEPGMEGTVRGLHLGPGDTVVLAARTIPGNERPLLRLTDRLLRAGVQVHAGPPFTASGHGCQEELEAVLDWVRPRALLPVHGNQRQLRAFAALAAARAIPSLLCQDGDVVALEEEIGVIARVPAARRAVAGSTVAAISEPTLHQRLRLASTGVVLVSGSASGLRVRALGVLDEGPRLQALCEDSARRGLAVLAGLPAPGGASEDAVRRAVRRVFEDACGFRPTVVASLSG